MSIRKRVTEQNGSNNAIETLANELADRPYGQKQDIQVRTSISLPASVLQKLEDIARENKRSKNSLKSVSAIIRHCIKKGVNV